MGNNSYKLILEAGINPASLKKIQDDINKIMGTGGKLGKINLTQNGAGEVTKSVVKYTDAVGNAISVTDKLGKTVTTTSINAKSGFDSFTQSMSQSIKTAAQYALSIGLIYSALNQVREGIQYVKDLNKELTNIQLVTGGTDAETAKLAVDYNNLAKEMGTTTVEVAKGSVEWIRQGKTAEETATLLKNSTMLSKLGNMEAADSTEKLTAIMNGFKLKAQETGGVIDKLVALDNSYATSVQEISTAMQYSSNSAQQAGVDFEHLAAYITIVSSTTRQSAETIGQAFKTMFARFTDIKAGKIDEDGLGINNVESALARVDIKLRDSKDSFRDIQDVIEELGKKWDTLSEVEQANLAKSIAGIRQKEQFLVLMNNQAEIQKAINKEEEATGLARERYDIYLKSIEASQNKLTASWEEMVSSGATKEMITDWYDAGTAVLGFINAIGGIPTVLKILIPLLVAFNLELIYTTSIAFGNSILGIVSAFKGLIGLLPVVTSGFGGVAAAEGVATAGAVAFTAAQAAATLGLSLLVAGLVFAISKNIEFNKVQAETRNLQKENLQAISQQSKTYEEYAEKTRDAAKEMGYLIDEQGMAYTQNGRGMRAYVDDVELMDKAMWDAINTTDAFDRAQGRVESTVTTTTDSIMTETQELQAFSETLKGLAETASAVDDLISKSNSAEGLSIEDAAKIPPEYLDALTVVGDKLRINIDLLKETQLQEAQTALTAIQSAQQRGEATSQQVAVVQMQYNQLLAESQHAFGAFSQTAWQYDALIWQISNDAITAGYNTFTDTAGNAMTSAQQIHDYMASSSGSFDNFVSQVANATGRSVSQVTGIITQMINNTINQLNTLQQQAEAARYNGLAALYGKTPSYGKSASLFPQVSSPSYGGYSGGGGSSGGGSSSQQDNSASDAQRELERQLSDARQEALDDLKDELSLYKDITDEKKKALDISSDEREYAQDVEDKNKEILKIQTELNALANDDSMEANARRLTLQDELNNLNQDLEDINYNQSVETQKNALDADYAAFQSQIENAIRAVEDISAGSLSSFASQLATILQGISMPVPTFHSGAEKGVIGNGTSLKSGEVFAKMMAGEVVSNAGQIDNFMTKTLPQMVQSSSTMNGGNIELNMPISIGGNLDRSTLPDLKKIVEAAVEQINKNMMNRGFNRRAEMFGN